MRQWEKIQKMLHGKANGRYLISTAGSPGQSLSGPAHLKPKATGGHGERSHKDPKNTCIQSATSAR
jgi:hypothetical protein